MLRSPLVRVMMGEVLAEEEHERARGTTRKFFAVNGFLGETGRRLGRTGGARRPSTPVSWCIKSVGSSEAEDGVQGRGQHRGGIAVRQVREIVGRSCLRRTLLVR
jgi:hypothetical protein